MSKTTAEQGRSLRELRIHLTEARNQLSRTEARLAEVAQEKAKILDTFQCYVCIDSIADMVSRCGHCVCEKCWSTWAEGSSAVRFETNGRLVFYLKKRLLFARKRFFT